MEAMQKLATLSFLEVCLRRLAAYVYEQRTRDRAGALLRHREEVAT